MIKPLSTLPSVSLYRAAETREIDSLAATRCGLPGELLMRRAGEALFEAIRESWPWAGSLRIYCGGGNNGGDGWILAGLAMNSKWQVRLCSVVDPEALKGEAAEAYKWALAQGVKAEPFSLDQEAAGASEVVVDALLGTGIRGAVREPFDAAIEQINLSVGPVVAVDIPSGLSADTGAIFGQAVKADLTLTFIAVKRGLVTGQGPGRCGDILLADLDVPEEAFALGTAGLPLLCLGEPLAPVPGKRSRSAHKGDFGRALILGGDYGYGGAALLAGEAALRAGCGLVHLGTRPEHVPAALARRPELMAYVADDAERSRELIERCEVIVCGPGLGQGAWGRRLLAMSLESRARLILDADALNLLAADDGIKALAERPVPTILTPHPGEAARLLGAPVSDIEQDRFAALARLVDQTGAWVVLKGAGALLGGPGAPPGGPETPPGGPENSCLGVCGHGNPGMATGGMGDVLSGLLAGVWAQIADPQKALTIAVCTHSAAADLAAEECGERGLLASDIPERAQMLLNPWLPGARERTEIL